MKVFKLPDLGEGLQDAEIVEWHVKVGDEIVADQPLVSVETAKAVVEIPSPYSGRITQLFGNPGEIVRLGAPLAIFDGAGDDADAGAVVGAVQVGQQVVAEAPAGIGRGTAMTKATPAVRALARRLDVELEMVTPSGEDPNRSWARGDPTWRAARDGAEYDARAKGSCRRNGDR
jgi:pyruvate dehydrogenase E2 component (dihydrolipoamide acetyltransferase)